MENSIIGWLEGVAIEHLMRNDKKFRVVKRDDKDFVVTQDFNPERYNLVVEHGHIKGVYLG